MNWTLISVVISIMGVAALLLVRWSSLTDLSDVSIRRTVILGELGEGAKESSDVAKSTWRASKSYNIKVIISIIVLLSALYVLVDRQDAETSLKDWAYTAVGTLVGFWLKA
jgi:hypothetical protein